MKQRIKQTIAALSLSLLSLSVQAATEGMDYTVLSHPIPQQQAGKIEVLEFSATSAFIVTISIRFCCNTAKPSLKMFPYGQSTSFGCLKCWVWPRWPQPSIFQV